MLKLPGKMTAEQFLDRHWQKEALFMAQAVDRLRPSVTRNELAWLATLEDVESRLVVTERSDSQVRYAAESGPFEPEFLASLPPRDWTLLVHDVEKHLPALRRLFRLVPFIPDWRIDDLMVSFAAPGGSVGPHRDNYDVFLCQGIGIREWQVSADDIAGNPGASDELALLQPFAGMRCVARQGDVLYLPPGVAHWGTAQRACLTYSIGMRAPQLSDLGREFPNEADDDSFYTDPDLAPDESRPGYISGRAIERARRLLGRPAGERAEVALLLGRFVTTTKEWLTPDGVSPAEAAALLEPRAGASSLAVHGMARIAFDQQNIYVNGRSHALPQHGAEQITEICRRRRVDLRSARAAKLDELLTWMAVAGAFEIPGKL